MSEHAVLAPSSAVHWVHCQGYVTLAASVVDEETDATREGTAAHWVAEQCLRAYVTPGAALISSSALVNVVAPNGVVTTEEMWDAAQIYVMEIMTVCNDHGLLQKLHIEERVSMPQIHERCWGTPDCWAFDDVNGVLYLWDFKFGHRRVEVFENLQMVAYMVGVMNAISPDREPPIVVNVRIVQPRCYDGRSSVTEWRTRSEDIRALVNVMQHAALMSFAINAPTMPGNHCRDCKNAAVCQGLRDAVATIIDNAGSSIPREMSPTGLGYELAKINTAKLLIETRQDALEADAAHRIKAGGVIPGWMMEQRYGHNKWNQPDELIIATGEVLGVNLLDKPKVLSPAGAAKVLKEKGIDVSVISHCYSKPPSSMKLVPDDGSKARQVFSKGGFNE